MIAFDRAKRGRAPSSLPVPFLSDSDDSGAGHLPVRLAGARGFVGIPDLAAGERAADGRLHLPGDRVRLRLLPLHLHPHLGESGPSPGVSRFLSPPAAEHPPLLSTPPFSPHFQVLWIIPFDWLRWALILVAIVISGSVLVLTFWPVVRDDTKVAAVATVATIVVLHTLLAIGCKVSERRPQRGFKLNPTGRFIPLCLLFQMYFFHTEVYIQPVPTANTSHHVTAAPPHPH